VAQVAIGVVPDEPGIGGHVDEIRETGRESDREDEREWKPAAKRRGPGRRSQAKDFTSIRSRFRL
jgi:hypothetical protein